MRFHYVGASVVSGMIGDVNHCSCDVRTFVDLDLEGLSRAL